MSFFLILVIVAALLAGAYAFDLFNRTGPRRRVHVGWLAFMVYMLALILSGVHW